MHRGSHHRLTGPLAVLALLAAGLAGAAPSAAAVPPGRRASTVTTTTAAPRIRSLTVSVSKGVTTMPSRLLAGTYYVHLTTTDADASLQVVRANVVRSSAYGALVNPGGRATFAITLAPGRYWLYSASGGSPYAGGKLLPGRLIRTLTVVGTAERATVPVAAVARFAGNTPTIPRAIPGRGFVLGVGEPGVITVLGFLRQSRG